MNSENEGERLSGGFFGKPKDALEQSIYPSIYLKNCFSRAAQQLTVYETGFTGSVSVCGACVVLFTIFVKSENGEPTMLVGSNHLCGNQNAGTITSNDCLRVKT